MIARLSIAFDGDFLSGIARGICPPAHPVARAAVLKPHTILLAVSEASAKLIDSVGRANHQLFYMRVYGSISFGRPRRPLARLVKLTNNCIIHLGQSARVLQMRR